MPLSRVRRKRQKDRAKRDRARRRRNAAEDAMTERARWCCETVLTLPEIMTIVMMHLPIDALLFRVPFVCQVWRDIASVFPLEIDTRDANLKLPSVRCPPRCGDEWRLMFQHVFRHFPCTQSITCLDRLSPPFAMGLRWRHLKSLRLNAATSLYRTVYYLQPVFIAGLGTSRTLQNLEMQSAIPEDLQTMAMTEIDLSHLRKLRISITTADVGAYSMYTPTLQTLLERIPNLTELKLIRVAVQDDDLVHILRTCPRLTTLYFEYYTSEDDPHAPCFNIIARHGLNLQDVAIQLNVPLLWRWGSVANISPALTFGKNMARDVSSAFAKGTLKRIRIKNSDSMLTHCLQKHTGPNIIVVGDRTIAIQLRNGPAFPRGSLKFH